jgi:hypothetical protein
LSLLFRRLRRRWWPHFNLLVLFPMCTVSQSAPPSCQHDVRLFFLFDLTLREIITKLFWNKKLRLFFFVKMEMKRILLRDLHTGCPRFYCSDFVLKRKNYRQKKSILFTKVFVLQNLAKFKFFHHSFMNHLVLNEGLILKKFSDQKHHCKMLPKMSCRFFLRFLVSPSDLLLRPRILLYLF